MKILSILLLIGLIVITTLPYTFRELKNQEYKTLFVQMGIIGLAVVAGIFLIYELREPSISRILNILSPIGK
jgi:TRAP-type C4-dicarboxylate transport system permease small subunit